MLTIEDAQAGDVEYVRKISDAIFKEYGDYSNVIPRFFATQGVHTYLARVRREVIGFVMLGFIPWTGVGGEDEEPWLADLLAIAVLPDQQRRKTGTALMERVFKLVDEMAGWRDVREIQLTCAASNDAGLQFFAKHGFRIIDSNHGAYSGGQEAWRLARSLVKS